MPPTWSWRDVVTVVLVVAVAILAFCLWRTDQRMSRNDERLYEWNRAVQIWADSVSRKIWGPGGDPCCAPPPPPPEMQ